MQIRTLRPDQILNWAEQGAGVVRLRTDRDVLPGGYLAAMLPMLVDWEESDADVESADAHAVLRLVRHGGNPLERTTVFRSMRLPLNRVECAEFTLVPYTPLASGTPLQHAQIRFIFEPGFAPELSDLGAAEAGSDVTVPDLVLGWGGWRRHDEPFSLIKALDESTFNLALRAHTGPQCYLEDALRGREWFSYPLQLPGGKAGASELLKVMLALGDGTARRTLNQMLHQDKAAWLGNVPASRAGEATATSRWADLQQRLSENKIPDDAPALPDAEQTYHALARSCVMLSRYSVLLAAARMVERGHRDGIALDRLPEASLGPTEAWMKEAAHSDVLGIFLRAPLALKYVLRFPYAMPEAIADELDAAGLLRQEDGQRTEIRYGRSAKRPYSSTGINP